MKVQLGLVTLLAAAALGPVPAAQAQISGFSAFAPANGSAVNNGVSLTLTDNGGSEAGSDFTSAAQDISSGFHTSFLYTVGGDKASDGFTFVLQNDPRGTSALGSGGGYLGYGGDSLVTNSVAVEFNFNQRNSTGLNTDGGIGTPINILNGVTLASGLPVDVTLSYDGAALTETLTQSGHTFSTVYTTGDLQTVLGGPTALIGFTGSDGGGTSTQTVSDFSFGSGPAPVPEASTLVSFGLLLGLGLGGVVLAKKKTIARA